MLTRRKYGGTVCVTAECAFAHVCVRTCYVYANSLSRPVKHTSVMHDTSLDFRDEVSRLLENARNLCRFPVQITRGREAHVCPRTYIYACCLHATRLISCSPPALRLQQSVDQTFRDVAINYFECV